MKLALIFAALLLGAIKSGESFYEFKVGNRAQREETEKVT